jgi:hypothetical protein
MSDADRYQRIIDVYRRGLITMDELNWEIFRASAKHFSPPRKV